MEWSVTGYIGKEMDFHESGRNINLLQMVDSTAVLMFSVYAEKFVLTRII